MGFSADDFVRWAADPARGVEERFGIESLCEAVLPAWHDATGAEFAHRVEMDRVRRKARSLNPGYRPVISAERLAEVVPRLRETTKLAVGELFDRPVRDISFLRFCPQLSEFRTNHSEIRDWSPLAEQRSLKVLHINDTAATELGVVAELVELEELSFHLRQPWPNLPDMGGLEKLANFRFSGNVLALGTIGRLPAVRTAKIAPVHPYEVPLRRMDDLPEMPELRQLTLEPTAALDGVGRYPRLLNLEIEGCFEELAPLAGLPELTHLTLKGSEYADLSPICGLQTLRRVVLKHDLPPDLTPLAELERLHEIVVETAAVVPPELGSLNEMCAPWDDEFAVDPPRPLGPLRVKIEDHRPSPGGNESPAEPRDWGEDHEMGHSEVRWFVNQVNRRLRKVLGAGWRRETAAGFGSPGHHFIEIVRQEDIDRLPQVLAVLRQILARCRHPWSFQILANTLGRYEMEMEDLYEPPDWDVFDPEREREEWEAMRQRRLEREEFLKRKYEHQLGLELGIEPPAAAVPAGAPVPEPDDEEDEASYDLGTNLELYFEVTETAVRINECDRDLANMLLDLGPDD